MTDQKKPQRLHGTRYKARRRAVDILFEAEARDIDPVAIVSDRVELAKRPDQIVAPINPYTAQIVEGVAVELDEIDDTIAANLSDEWKLERLPAVDRAILRMSVWELLFNHDVPVNTAVVEGTDLAAEYADPRATPYINAVLDTIAAKANDLRQGIDPAAASGLASVEDQLADVDSDDSVVAAANDVDTDANSDADSGEGSADEGSAV